MKKLNLLYFLTLLLISCASEKRAPGNSHDLVFQSLPVSWDEGIPLGNGKEGLLIWEKDDRLRFSLDCSEFWDLRPMENIGCPEFKFRWVYDQWKRDNYKVVQEKFDEPYERVAAPSKIPAAALEFDTKRLGAVKEVRLDIQRAICTIKWTRGAVMEVFVDAAGECGWYNLTNANGITPELVPPAYSYKGDSTKGALSRLGYVQGKIEKDKNTISYLQNGWGDFKYSVSVAWNTSDRSSLGCWKIRSGYNKDINPPDSSAVLNIPGKKEFKNALAEHLKWWNEYWNASSVSLPDSVLERQWYLEMYKFGSAARKDAPPISLQAVWTADDGHLPPWKGDFHHDLNTQLSYWPAYSSNHTDLSEGFTGWLWKHRDEFKKYTKEYFETDGLNVPGVTTLDGKPMGGWIQYACGLTVSSWLAQHFYLQWKYTLDEVFLREEAYPWIKDVSEYLEEISVTDKTGKRCLPLSSSPEFNDNSSKAWFPSTTNFDLSLIRSTYTWATEMAVALGKSEEADHWKKCLSEWPDLAVDSLSGLLIAPGYRYEESHRHFSHLMAIYPLGLISINNGKKEQEIIEKSIDNLEKYGTDNWTGYSYAWLGNIYARTGRGDDAAHVLRVFSQCFCLPNSFHVNGDQSGTGKSTFTYKPFTLEGNFAFASAIQEMLMQSNKGIIRIFPAIPTGWKNVSFRTLRAEGAVLVSASMQEGEVKEVTITSDKGGLVKLMDPFENKKAVSLKPLIIENDLISFYLKAGETVTLRALNRSGKNQ